MGMNEVKTLTSFFLDLMEMHEVEDVKAAMAAALEERSDEPMSVFDVVKMEAAEKRVTISLPELFVQRIERFGNEYAIHVNRSTFGADVFKAVIWDNGKVISSMFCNTGNDKCKEMAKAALRGYLCKRERKMRRTAKKNAVGKAVAK